MKDSNKTSIFKQGTVVFAVFVIILDIETYQPTPIIIALVDQSNSVISDKAISFIHLNREKVHVRMS